jgi:hypothetical protein
VGVAALTTKIEEMLYIVLGLILYANICIPILFSKKTLSRFEVLEIEIILKLTLELIVGHSLYKPLVN